MSRTYQFVFSAFSNYRLHKQTKASKYISIAAGATRFARVFVPRSAWVLKKVRASEHLVAISSDKRDNAVVNCQEKPVFSQPFTR